MLLTFTKIYLGVLDYVSSSDKFLIISEKSMHEIVQIG